MNWGEPLYQSPWTSPTSEWWVLNPGPFIDLCFDAGIERFVFTEKIARFIPNMRLAPDRLLTATSRGRPWRAIVVEADSVAGGHVGRVAVEYGPEHWFERPVAVYPLWSATLNTTEELIDLCENYDEGRPIGRFYGGEVDMHIQEEQERRVLIRSFPTVIAKWEALFSEVSKVKAMYPEFTFHYHGGKSTTRTIGMGIDAFDHPTRIRWINGFPELILPNGEIVRENNYMSRDIKLWSDLIGRKPQHVYEAETSDEMSRLAYAFNLMSLKWLVSNYDSAWYPGIGGLANDGDLDVESPDEVWRPRDDLVKLPDRLKRERYDRWLCDVCSVAVSCPYARPGAVCVVEDSEAATLVDQFKSRRASDIVEGMAQLVAINTERIKTGLQYEVDKGKIDPAVSKLIDSTFDRGLQLAKLRDPAIAAQMGSGTKVQIGIATNGGAANILQASNPAELAAGVAAMLQEEGIPIEEATEDDVKRVLGAIEARATDG